MKNLSIVAFLLLNYAGGAQTVGIGTTVPNASAALEIRSTNKGLLIPRTSTVSRTAITSPAKGLMVYDTTTGGFWFHNGNAWTQIQTAGSSWSLTGNAGIDPATNFIGTTNNQPLRFRINNIYSGEIDSVSGRVYLGFGAGRNTTGFGNTGIGSEAMSKNGPANYNTAFGYRALRNNGNGANIAADEATRNTAVGFEAMQANTTGLYNTALGFGALSANVTGFFNTGVGHGALSSNISGKENTAVGLSALNYNTGDYNTATGSRSLGANLTGVNNTADGAYGLYSNTTGQQNTASGYAALYSNVVGNYNTASGAGSLNSNTADWNTADGAYALYQNSSGTFNTATGGYALTTNSSGGNNTAAGYKSLYANTTGGLNTASGSNALAKNISGGSNTATGVEALNFNVSGSENTAVGVDALLFNTTGSKNTAIGIRADVNADDLTNATAIGADAIVYASNTIQLGNSKVTSVVTSGNLTVGNNHGIVRNSGPGTQTMFVTSVLVNGSISPNSVKKIPFTFGAFVSSPAAFVGDILPGGTGAEGMSMYITGLTVTGGTLNVFFINNGLLSTDFNFTVHIITVGNQYP